MQRNKHTLSTVLVVIVVVNLIVGIFIAGDFGRSYDTPIQRFLGDFSYHSYKNILRPDLVEETFSMSGKAYTNMHYYGPAFETVSYFMSHTITSLFPNVNLDAAYNLTIFLTFQLSIWFLYKLALNFFQPFIAFGVALLYGYQPLFFGHSFINSKDIPFMAVFLATLSIVLTRDNDAPPIIFSDISDWFRQKFKNQQKTYVIIYLSVFSALILLRITEKAPQRIISVIVFSLSLVFFFVGVLLYFENSPIDTSKWKFEISFVDILKTLLNQFKNELSLDVLKKILLLAAFTGFGIAIRSLGFVVAGMVSIVWYWKYRGKSLIYIFPYVALTVGFTILFWPYTWHAPLDVFLNSLFLLTNYPWYGNILFQGAVISSLDVPMSYLPILLSIQLTIPVVLLSLFGLAILLYRIYKTKEIQIGMIIVLLWFFLPFLYVLYFTPVLYDNFRQFIFILPPLFIFSGIALEAIMKWVKPTLGKTVLLLTLLAPAFYALITLHPYQYIYYNQFVGGVPGASRSYELDYWNLSYKSAFDYINEHADYGTVVGIYGGNMNSMQVYSRPDLILVSSRSVGVEEMDWALITTRSNRDYYHLVDVKTIHSITLQDAPLAHIKVFEK